jgi:hypothetical protein
MRPIRFPGFGLCARRWTRQHRSQFGRQSFTGNNADSTSTDLLREDWWAVPALTGLSDSESSLLGSGGTHIGWSDTR